MMGGDERKQIGESRSDNDDRRWRGMMRVVVMAVVMAVVMMVEAKEECTEEYGAYGTYSVLRRALQPQITANISVLRTVPTEYLRRTRSATTTSTYTLRSLCTLPSRRGERDEFGGVAATAELHTASPVGWPRAAVRVAAKTLYPLRSSSLAPLAWAQLFVPAVRLLCTPYIHTVYIALYSVHTAVYTPLYTPLYTHHCTVCIYSTVDSIL